MLEARFYISARESITARIISITLSLISIVVLSWCFARRLPMLKNWRRLPPVRWLTLVIYLFSIVFCASTAIISNAFGVNSSARICSQAIILCLSCYLSTKLFLYYFLVERAYIMRSASKPRHKDLLYIFNAVGMLVPYLAVVVLNYIFRFADYKDGECRIGMHRWALIPLIVFDVVVNVYLTSLFIIPLRLSYSYKHDHKTSPVYSITLRTFIGSCLTLISTIVNFSFVYALGGEPGWVCLIFCNSDILFCVVVLHWVTSRDHTIDNYSTTRPIVKNAAMMSRPRITQHIQITTVERTSLEMKEDPRMMSLSTMCSSGDLSLHPPSPMQNNNNNKRGRTISASEDDIETTNLVSVQTV